jgi:hypothetical protein
MNIGSVNSYETPDRRMFCLSATGLESNKNESDRQSTRGQYHDYS